MANQGPTGVAPVLQVHPTRRCNLACAHCYTSSGPRAREELEPELLSTCLADAVALGYRQLAVSGGEPLLYPALHEVLANAKELGMLTTLTTNGMLGTHDRWRSLAPLLDLVAVSIDGTPADHDSSRRQKGAFERTVANMSTLSASGIAFGFIFTLTQHNADSLEFVVRLAAEHGAQSVQVHPLSLHGRAKVMLPTSRPDGIELTAAIAESARLGAALGVAVHVDALTIDQLSAHRSRMVPRRPVARFVDVCPVLVLESNATVTPLTHELHPDWRLGSIREQRLSVLTDNWLASGKGNALAALCNQTWTELSSSSRGLAYYWYEEVGMRSGPRRLDFALGS